MMYWFRKKIIGGDTGSTEGAWFLVFCWMIGAAVIFYYDISGADTARATDLLENLAYAVLAVWASAHGIKKIGQNFGSQDASFNHG